MPQFSPNEPKVAIAPMSNPTAKAFSYTAELYLGVPKAASSGEISFSLAAGETRNITFPVTMPGIEGSYPVYLDVFSNSQLIAAYKAIEDVTIIPILSDLAKKQIAIIEGQGFETFVTPETTTLMNWLALFAYYEDQYMAYNKFAKERIEARDAANAEIKRLGKPGYAWRAYPGVPREVGTVKIDNVTYYNPLYNVYHEDTSAIIFPYQDAAGYYYWRITDPRYNAFLLGV